MSTVGPCPSDPKDHLQAWQGKLFTGMNATSKQETMVVIPRFVVRRVPCSASIIPYIKTFPADDVDNTNYTSIYDGQLS